MSQPQHGINNSEIANIIAISQQLSITSLAFVLDHGGDECICISPKHVQVSRGSKAQIKLGSL